MNIFQYQYASILTSRLDPTLELYRNRVQTLAAEQAEAQAELESIRRVIMLAQGLRRGISMPQFMSANEMSHWLFVRKLELELIENTLQINELECVVIAEVLQPQTRYELPPGETDGPCEDIVHTPDMLVTEITSGLTGVEAGGWDDIMSVPCDICGVEAPLVCHRCLDYGREMLDIGVGILCLNCPQYFETAGLYGFKGSVPFLTAK